MRAALVACAVTAWSCGSMGTPSEPNPAPETPTSVTPTPNPNPTPTPLLGAPGPKPTPTPEPGATPDPGGSTDPDPEPPGDAGNCRAPVPGPLAQMNVKIHQRGDNHWTLDSTPLVGPDAAYCAKIGFTDGRAMCPVRVEGHPERQACELYVMGRAQDTKRPGPTWYVDGALCTGRPNCENHPDNQYLLVAYKAGLYKACGNKNQACGDVTVDR